MKKNIIITVLVILVIILFFMLLGNREKDNNDNSIVNNAITEKLNKQEQNETNNEIENEVVNEVVNKNTTTEVKQQEGNKEQEKPKEEKAQTKVSFTKNSYFAIGYVPENKEEQFIKKYFDNKSAFNSLPTVNLGDVNKFVVIPKNEDTEIKVWTCSLSEEGEIKKDKLFFTNKSGAIIVETGEVEYIPNVIIEINYNGKQVSCPLQFSGQDGSLVVPEASVLDITIY